MNYFGKVCWDQNHVLRSTSWKARSWLILRRILTTRREHKRLPSLSHLQFLNILKSLTALDSVRIRNLIHKVVASYTFPNVGEEGKSHACGSGLCLHSDWLLLTNVESEPKQKPSDPQRALTSSYQVCTVKCNGQEPMLFRVKCPVNSWMNIWRSWHIVRLCYHLTFSNLI